MKLIKLLYIYIYVCFLKEIASITKNSNNNHHDSTNNRNCYIYIILIEL